MPFTTMPHRGASRPSVLTGARHPVPTHPSTPVPTHPSTPAPTDPSKGGAAMTQAPTRPLGDVARRVIRRQPRSLVPVAPTPVPSGPPREPFLRRHGVRVALALAVVYVIWGSTYLAIDVAMTTVPPMLLMAVRFALAGALLYVWAARRGDRVGDRPTPRQWVGSAFTGGMMLVGGTGLVALAMVYIGAGTAALLTATVPVWLALFARAIYGDRLSVRAWIGLAIGLVGVGFLVDPAGGQLGGMLLAVLGAMGWAAGSLRSRVASAPSRPMVAASMEMLGASVIFLLLGIAMGEPGRLDLAGIGVGSWVSLVYLVTAGSLVAFVAYRWLLSNASAALVGTHAYVNPIVAVLLAAAFLGERLTGRALVAGGIILVSIVLVITGRPGEPVPAQATSGADVFAGEGRWRQARRRLGRMPAVGRLYVSPGAPQYRRVGYDEDLVHREE